jgi:hypothetical protein
MTHLKIMNASLGPIRKYKSLKSRLYNCNASIYFNRQCLKKQLTPKYANIKIPNTSPAHKYTQQKAATMRIKDEIKYLYSKKQDLNQQIYHLHLSLAHTWSNTWHYIYETIEGELNREAKAKYKALDKKLDHLRKTQSYTPHSTQSFYPRLINNTDILFSKNELNLLHKGLKYNLHTKPKDWVQNLALEAETAITHLPTNEREVYRKLVANEIQKITQQNTSNNTHPESKLIKSIKTKLSENNATLTRADKGNSIVILPTLQYEEKIENFLQDNNFHKNTSDPTTPFQSQIRNMVKQSKTLIPKDHRWRYINMNPSAPTIKGLIKIHKENQPIRPVVNWRNAPAYQLSKLFTNTVNLRSPLPHALNIKNSKDLILELSDTPTLPQHTMASLDITNLYASIPVDETRKILNTMLENNHVDTQEKSEILMWYDVITKQNYFAHNNNIVIQRDGLAMGAPSSGLIAEMFLQQLEHRYLAHLTHKHHITFYCRYVDDIFLLFDASHSNIHDILTDFNTIHQNIHFTAETESNHTLNYLDITIRKTPSDFEFAIYRKPTFTDTIIPHTSNHPTQHKYAAIRSLHNRLNAYNLKHKAYQQELNTIQNILKNNSFPIKPHKPRPPKPPPQKDNTTTPRSGPDSLTSGGKPPASPTFSVTQTSE